MPHISIRVSQRLKENMKKQGISPTAVFNNAIQKLGCKEDVRLKRKV